MKRHACPTGRHPEPAYGCYCHHRCRCKGCREINTDSTRQQKAVRLRLGIDRPGMVPADPIRALVRWLREEGATDTWIAGQVGMSESAICYLRNGRNGWGQVRWTLAGNAAAIRRLARRVAQGEIQPPGFREAQRRKLQRDRRRRQRAA